MSADKEWVGDDRERAGDDPSTTYRNAGMENMGAPRTHYVLAPISGAAAMLTDYGTAYPQSEHGSVIVSGTQWDAVLVLIPHAPSALPRVVVSRHPERPAHRDADHTPDTLRFVRVPRLPGHFWTFFDPAFVANPDNGTRILLAHLPAPDAP